MQIPVLKPCQKRGIHSVVGNLSLQTNCLWFGCVVCELQQKEGAHFNNAKLSSDFALGVCYLEFRISRKAGIGFASTRRSCVHTEAGEPGASRVRDPCPGFGRLLSVCALGCGCVLWVLFWWLGGRATPDPIPNSEVKSPSADGSPFWARVGRRQNKVCKFLYFCVNFDCHI